MDKNIGLTEWVITFFYIQAWFIFICLQMQLQITVRYKLPTFLLVKTQFYIYVLEITTSVNISN